ncbi:MAG TPA: prolyl oligopeptidase family serine peptidase [Thermomicrobiales bacterium]|nr:prolyl oligopeptidase family serine peptidase [Thermomicrobiales bacterium]
MSTDDAQAALRQTLERYIEDQRHRLDVLQRQVDDLMFFQRLGDIAEIDLVSFTGPPPRYVPNPTAQGAGNPLILRAYVFIPRDLDLGERHPLIVQVHGGIHANFASGAANIVRELLLQGYTVIAPEYRGSTGYGRAFYEQIDYGGLETADSHAARAFALETYPFLDPARVGIIGWSHGGLHTLMNIFDHPDAYAAAYAAVPVSDLVARMGYKSQGYRDLMAAPYHIGKTAEENVAEYRRRSPSWQAHRYAGTPLLIHTTTNDEDVNVLEVERLIQALKAAGKEGFEYKIYEDAPGGHQFNRLDTPLARASRREAYRFLARYLRPVRPIER